MVQIGNMHIGKAETAAPPTVSIIEAGLIWDMLAARYKCIEETNYYFTHAHDPDFKTFVSRMGMELIKGQAEELEKQCQIFGIPMPDRPPKAVTKKEGSSYFNDEFMFRQIFEGCQHFLGRLANVISSITTNDALRKIFEKFFTDELYIFNNLCKYGKMKGWLKAPPVYKAD
ncbi:MAG: DUF3231 family protein [Bacillota bacterium]|nr:DUF3231 family protein [Bacillota bacterium]MDW7682879.1 DUF3231 family protein [Bacillota bacterium]